LTERVRLFALVRGEPRQTRHFAGPTEPAGPPLELPWPDIVLIEERPEGVFLFRFSADGEDAGDTWHRTVDAAKDQARDEYGDVLTEWRSVPSEVSDAEEYVISQASTSK